MDERTVKRFWSKVSIGGPDNCWPWKPLGSVGGYGQFSTSGKHYYAHRFAYEVAKEPIPAGLEIDHLCRNRTCCNPAHLEAVTRMENLRRAKFWEKAAAYQRGKTHCANGHPFAGDNLHIATSGQRVCRACSRRNSEAARQRKREREGPKTMGRPCGTHCPRGHPYDEENTYVSPKNGRYCRACKREQVKRYRAKRRAQNPPEPRRACKNGHEWTPENTYVNPSTGFRACRACHNERTLTEYYARKAVRPPKPRRTHCKHGHELGGDNIYTSPGGRKFCRACADVRRKAYEQEQARRREGGSLNLT